MILRAYQIDLAKKATKKLHRLGIVYLACEMRIGKTLIALLTAYFIKGRRVLFITKKMAISSILSDFENFDFGFELHVCNYEQIDTVGSDYDVIIIDEAHSLGAFPKPALRTKRIRAIVGMKYVILLSGTPSPESYSQLYHQFWISERSPFKEFANFYRWAREFVKIKDRMINGLRIRDYKDADREKIVKVAGEYFLSYTQNQAGFEQEIIEHICFVDLAPSVVSLVRRLITERCVRLPGVGLVIADTAVKLQSKIHQLCSGTLITEDGTAAIVDESKANYIKQSYYGKKIAIFYKYKGEREILCHHFSVTESPEEFNSRTDRIFISQVRSGAMGVNLSTADVIVFYNIDFSSQSYWQARARMQSQMRVEECRVDWIFSRDGIEQKIYDAVIRKKNYTTTYFRRDYGGKTASNKNYRIPARSRSICRKSIDCQPFRCA